MEQRLADYSTLTPQGGSRAIRRARQTASIRANRGKRNACSGGGSFLRSDQYCSRYVLGSRGKGESDFSGNYISFRWMIGTAKVQLGR
jgi:sulfatase modifying factor 1